MAPRPGRSARTCAATRRPARARAGSARRRRAASARLGSARGPRRSPGGVIRTRTCSNPHRNSGVSPAVARLRRHVDSRPCSPPPPSVRRAYSGSPSPPEPVRRSGSSCSPTSSTAPRASSRSATSARPRTTRTGSSTSRTRCSIGVEASVQGALDSSLARVDLQPPVPDRPARRDPGRADLPVVPLPADLPDAAQHDPGDVAAVGAGLRPVPGRSAAAGRHRDRGHDQHAHRHGHELERVDELLQRARRGAEPARRLRDGRRLRAVRRGAQPRAALRGAAVGPDHRADRGRHRQPLRVRRASPGSSPACSATASASWRRGSASSGRPASRSLGPAFAEA